MESKAFEQYAQMLVELLGLQPGQGLVVKSEPVNWPVVTAIAEAAYERGAKIVQPFVVSTALHRARVEHSAGEYLEFVPDERRAWQKQFLEEHWALISVKSPDDPDALAGIDPDRHGTVSAAYSRSDHPFRESLANDENQWLVAVAPSPGWAAKILDTVPSREAQVKLWQLLKPILRLDREAPASFWRQHSDLLQRRCAILDDLGLRELRFKGEGTELSVGLTEEAVWTGGAAETPEGVSFMPNIPTEEVFTTPDFRKTSGVVRATRPVTVLGDLVEGANFRFEEGRVVEASATRGEETLKRFLDVDEGSRYLGEVALVDGSSPIYQSGHLFYNTLLDENAACHIALGNAYPGCLRGGNEMNPEELTKAGANRSLQHADFMIGSAEVSVTGITGDGSRIEILREGKFLLKEEDE